MTTLAISFLIAFSHVARKKQYKISDEFDFDPGQFEVTRLPLSDDFCPIEKWEGACCGYSSAVHSCWKQGQSKNLG